ncbi:HAD family acid phosphatase [Tersicoccus sp. MR15.9]|uniref:phosphatase domain-containing protein n=1 Tax=Tersicoccus mangrovi TaxID=3121635 RepID=UPI002FE5986B
MDTANRPPAIICDVDGTLCDVRSIRHHVERPEGTRRFRADFALFHSSSEDCPAFPDVLQLITELERNGYAIVVVTAREARWSELTERWLDRHGVRRTELITRRTLDYRPDALIKAEICTEIQNRYSPRLAIDDRADTLAVWADASIPTVKINEAGLPSQVRWHGVVTDNRLSALVERVSSTTGTAAWQD